MTEFKIERNIEIKETEKVKQVMVDFDVQLEHLNRIFEGKLEFPENWQIGLIVGNSGTGKSTIARELFKVCDKFEYTHESVIDDIPADYDSTTRMFYSVGFGSVPCWLKPYKVLSNGEQMRVDLARALLENDFCVFDEFTSVVDRNVAQTMCIALNKCLKKNPTKKFIAITCHKDVEEWLQPDWIFNTDTMQMSFHLAHDLKKDSRLKNVTGVSGQSLGTIII